MQLIQIGNSMGVRIPKPIIQQAGLDSGELTMHLVEEGLLLTVAKPKRAGWEETAKMQTILNKEELPFKGGNDFDKEDWKW